MRRVLIVGWLMAAVALPLAAQDSIHDDPLDPATESAAADRIRDARRDLVELRFEDALAAADALLADPDLAEVDRVAAWVLRSEAHVALGALRAAEEDYREILTLRPGWSPEAALTPKKALERFRKVHGALVGRVVVRVDPAEARVAIDGRDVELDAEGGLPLVAGEHSVRFSLEGFDTIEQSVSVEPAGEREVRVELVPNARSVLVLTSIEDVEVVVDGVSAGRTRRPLEEVAGSAVPQLLVENLSLREHVFELSKPCFQLERRREMVSVDLLDRSPQRLGIVRLERVWATVALTGGPKGARLSVDGEERGVLPREPLALCPGSRTVAVRFGGRTIWTSSLDLVGGREDTVDVTARPNVALVGAERWPDAMAAFAARWNTTHVAGVSRIPTDVEGWSRVQLPRDTDLAMAPLPATGRGAGTRWQLYSPILGVAEVVEAPPEPRRPDWTRPVWGFAVVDSRLGGSARVVRVDAGGAAAAAGLEPGDRIVSLGGIDVRDAAQLRRLLRFASARAPLAATWHRPDGTEKSAGLVAKVSPELRVEPVDGVDSSVRAAWAVVDGVCASDHADSAQANLALLYSAHGRHDLAVATWRRVAWPERAGIGAGTAQYYLGVALERLGREAEAVRAYTLAAGSPATAFDDEGPPVAPAARDRLADLGALSP